jgi:hypothetical protein
MLAANRNSLFKLLCFKSRVNLSSHIPLGRRRRRCAAIQAASEYTQRTQSSAIHFRNCAALTSRENERERGSDYCVQPLPGYKKTDRLFCQQSQSFLMDRSAVKRFNHPLHNKSRPRARSPLFCAHNAPRETHFARRAAATAARDLNFAAEKYTNCVAPKCSPLAARTRRNAFG